MTYSQQEVDSCWAEEWQIAKEIGWNCALIDQSWMFGGEVKSRYLIPEQNVIYRGWLLNQDSHRKLFAFLDQREYQLIPSPLHYQFSCSFPKWYFSGDLRKYTPKSYVVHQGVWLDALLKNPEELSTIIQMKFEKDSGLIIKDFVKSRKHEWLDACYVPNISDGENLNRVVHNFVQRQKSDGVFEGGLIFREYVPFKKIGVHPKSGLPLVNEHRIFVFRGQIFFQVPYWLNVKADYTNTAVPNSKYLQRLVEKIFLHTDFFAMDVAELDSGEWLMVELNDGSTAGLPEGADLKDFYSKLLALQ